MDDYIKCNLCPRECDINREKNIGYCGGTDKIKVALASLFTYEEPCISGKSGAIFFSNCNMKCCFCQNKDISTDGNGLEISIERLSEIMLELESKGADNINLVTPTHYVPSIIESIKIAKSKGLKVPIIYNTSGYEKVETIKKLKGYIDVYLPDLKYYDDSIAIKYSKCKNYFKYASSAILEMYNQVGPCKFDKNGMITSGLIVRHLVLPDNLLDSKKILQYLYKTYKDNIYISIMSQYTPCNKTNYPELNRSLTDSEYDEIVLYAYKLGIRNCYCQEGKACLESFIPKFNYEGVKKETTQ